MNYRITWEIDIEADSPHEAAQLARNIQLDPDSTVTFFKTVDEGKEMTYLIDLDDYSDD